MALIGLQNVTIAFGGPPLLDEVAVQIEAGERVCLVGRNGAGKSTFLKLLLGTVEPDDGVIIRQQGLRVAALPQELPAPSVFAGRTVFDMVAGGLGELGQTLADYHHALLAEDHDDDLTHRLQTRLDRDDGWALQQKVESAIARVELSPDTPFTELSGGQQRRALLAAALAADPDILLLDEPTNHLDVETIAWLESTLPRIARTLVFITHDRVFLQALATRILEIDRGQLSDWRCDYPTYLERRQTLLDAEEKQNAIFDKKLAAEEVWIRQGIKARRTRNEGRVRALKALRRERQARRERTGTVNLELETGDRSGRIVVKAEDADFGYGDKVIVRGLTTTIMRGDKVGIIGPNGAGKTTLMRGLLGQLPAMRGSTEIGTRLQIAYFDQLREELDPTKTLIESISEKADTVTINGKSRHIISYLQDFLFAPDRARSPVSVLSGGERNRLVLARLFTRPANLLIMDEPTNDLDVETLELLEDLLVEYSGTVLLVSHDRAFLDNVAGSTLAWMGDGVFREFVGGYSDYLVQAARLGESTEPAQTLAVTPEKPKKKAGKGLSYKEKQELLALPLTIEKLETEQAALTDKLADPATYKEAGDIVVTTKSRLDAVAAELAKIYDRWADLEERNADS